MAVNWKVIHCSIDELASELNQLDGEFAPAVFHFVADTMPLDVVVIATRPPKQQTMAVPFVMPAGRRN